MLQEPNESWLTFQKHNPDWRIRFSDDQPIYAIDQSLLNSQDLQKHMSATWGSEIEYSKYCSTHKSIGMYDDRPIEYDLFQYTTTQVHSTSLDDEGNWMMVKYDNTETNDRVAERRSRLQGVAGWLLTNSTFLEELHKLKTDYVANQMNRWFPFPLKQSNFENAKLEDQIKPLPEEAKRFGQNARLLLNRWGLNSLTTWDLPEPQGMLLPNPFPTNYGIPDTLYGVHIYIPVHYPLQLTDGIVKQIRAAQKRAALFAGLPDTFGGIKHFQECSQILHIIYFDAILRSRFTDRLPPGLSSRIPGVLAAYIGLSEERIRALQKKIKKSRKEPLFSYDG